MVGKGNDKKAFRTDSSGEPHHGHGKFNAARRRSGSNLVGKFTQSVKRIVQEVKEEGVPADGDTRDEAISTNQRLRGVKRRLEEASDTVKQVLLGLRNQYHRSKRTYNPFTRHVRLKSMIKEVVRLELEYWHLMDAPKQDKQETVNGYVLRACIILEKNYVQRGTDHEKQHKASEEDTARRENAERLNGMTTSQILEENQVLTNELYRLLRKYTSLRTLMRELKDDYVDSKIYPIVPRYFMLKAMIRDVMRDPAFIEISNEMNQAQPPASTAASL